MFLMLIIIINKQKKNYTNCLDSKFPSERKNQQKKIGKLSGRTPAYHVAAVPTCTNNVCYYQKWPQFKEPSRQLYLL